MIEIDYFCVFREEPRDIPKKGHKSLAFSSRYQFSGLIEIDGIEYTVKFSSYDDLNKLIDGTYNQRHHLWTYTKYTQKQSAWRPGPISVQLSRSPRVAVELGPCLVRTILLACPIWFCRFPALVGSRWI
jgi:hypothetical protein